VNITAYNNSQSQTVKVGAVNEASTGDQKCVENGTWLMED